MRVAAVIPALNEEATIGDVVSTLRHVDIVEEVIVVSDGSTDHTADLARSAGARVIEHKENMGKAAAMKTGFDATGAPVVLFMDADLIGLTPTHVMSLLAPLLSNGADMTVGVFEDGRGMTDLAQLVAPYLSGQRAVRRDVVTEMFREDPEAIDCRFGIEVALTRHVNQKGYRKAEVSLGELSHRMKEEKLGPIKGAAARLKMYYEILKYAATKG
ncbi:MAG TPA: glycosyltransferase family 2 protein [Symbiobacteriaceae bacterium]|nr:glycosyltransferase family 2 protein [Symbiobacteriaceae bacterium]